MPPDHERRHHTRTGPLERGRGALRVSARRPHIVDQQDSGSGQLHAGSKLELHDVVLVGISRHLGPGQQRDVSTSRRGAELAHQRPQRALEVPGSLAGWHGRQPVERLDSSGLRQASFVADEVTVKREGELRRIDARQRTAQALVSGQRLMQLTAPDAVRDRDHRVEPVRAVVTRVAAIEPVGEVEAGLTHPVPGSGTQEEPLKRPDQPFAADASLRTPD